jgi:pimeloyl-ACP methyl ester carboxylesterase
VLHFLSQHLWLIVAGGGGGVAGRYLQLYIRRTQKLLLPDPTVDLLRLQQSCGYNAHTLVGIAPGIRGWTCPETGGAVAYNEFGKVWLIPGDPLATAENLAKVTEGFLRKARAEGRVVGFMPATEQFARCSSGVGLRAVKVGSAPYFDLATWAPRGDRAKKARAGVNQARRAGVRVSEVRDVDEKLVRETACLCKSWLTTRRSAIRFAWLFSVDLFQHTERKKYFTARDPKGRLVGFLAASPIPARDGWYLEDVLRAKDAPNGTSDLLVVAVLELLKRDGAKLATLGTAPMAMEGHADPEVHISVALSKLTRVIATCFSLFYNFGGIRRFKTKFAPSWWESEYILFSKELTAPPRIIRAFVHAIVPAGPTTLVARQINRAWQRMSNASGAAKAPVPSEIKGRADEKQSVAVNGIALHYVSAGSGPPVVLIHGNPGSHQDFTLSVFEKLAQRYHVLAFDRPGHGHSERSGSIETTVEVQAAMIRDALQKLSIEKPLLVGHSWGGSLALAAAVADGSDLSGIVLLAPAAYPSVTVEWWSHFPRVPFFGKFLVKTVTPFVGRTVVKGSLKDAYHPQDVHDDYAARSATMWMHPDRIAAWANDENTLRASLAALSQRYSEIEIPVVIVTGDGDRVLDPKQHAYPLHETIRLSKLVVLPQTGHQLPQTQPDAVIAAIDEVWRLASERK